MSGDPYIDILRPESRHAGFRGTVAPIVRPEAGSRDLLAALFRARGDRSLAELREALVKLIDRRIILVPSGRAGIAHLLSALPHEEVVLPAYSSETVKGAVEVAGKKAVYVDIAPGAVNAGVEQFASEAKPGRVLIPTHLFGVPAEIEAICRLARDRGCVTIEDSAAAFMAQIGGRPAGTFGDFGILSFERIKHFAAFRGGAIIVNDTSLIDEDTLGEYRLTRTREAFPLREIVHALGYNVATTPWLYGRLFLPLILRHYPRRAEPGFRHRTEHVHSDAERALEGPFYSRAFDPYQASLLKRVVDRIDLIRGRLERLVKVYREELDGSHVRMLVPAVRDDAALLQLPIAVPDGTRVEFLRRALARGIHLDTNYERILAEPPSSHSRFPNSLWAADNVVLLPLYSRLSDDQARRIAHQVAEIADELA